jgi:hypothetical protein
MRKNEAQQGFQPKNRIKKLCKELVPLNTKAGFFCQKEWVGGLFKYKNRGHCENNARKK